MLELLPCLDSPQMAADRKRELWMDRGVAAQRKFAAAGHRNLLNHCSERHKKYYWE